MKIEQNVWTQKTGWQPSTPRALGKSAQLVLVFGSTDLLKQSPLLKTLAGVYPNARFVGCSTAGEICGTTVYDDSLTTVAVYFEKTTVRSYEIEVVSAEDSFLAGERLAALVGPANLSHLFVLSKGVNVNGSELVKGLVKNLPENVIITGGMAGDGPKFQETLTFSDGIPKNNVVSAIAFYGHNLKVGYGSVGGWDTFGPERIITRSKGNVLYELDGKNALDIYKQYLGEHAKGLPATGLLFPLGIRDNEATTRLVRTILATNDKEQSITFAGDVPEGYHARLMKVNYERMIDAAAKAAKNCQDTIDCPKVELAIIVSCCGRKWILKQRVEEEIEAVREVFGKETVLTGFYSYGEIAPLAGTEQCALHNETMTITALFRGLIMDKMHSLLKRQLKKSFGSADNIPKDFQEIIGVINEAYFNFDADRLLLERSIEISSHELLEANSQMRSIFQALPDMFLRIDTDGKILECKIPANNTFSHIHPNELVGKSIYTTFGPLAARRLEWAVRRAVKNKTIEIAEYSVQNQTEQFCESRVVWLGNDQLVVIVRDITERKLDQDRLIESRRMLQTLMGNLPGMAYRCRNDRDWTMEFVSEGSVNLTGYQPAEIINNSKIAYNQLIHPDECEKVWDTIQASLKEHKMFQVTYRIKTADGEQKWVLEQGQGIFSSKGELLAIEGFVSDSTDKVKMQESIKESECFLSEVFACIQDGISVLDTDLNIIRTNAAMEKWYAHAMPLTGKKCYEAYHGRKTRCDACPTCRTLETGKAEYEMVPKTGPDGKVVGWIDLYSFPLIDGTTGKLKGVIEYVREINDANAHRGAEKYLAESIEHPAAYTHIPNRIEA